MEEAFLYRWTNTLNGKKYIGVHKGSPDDGYVCSQSKTIKGSIWEDFDHRYFVRDILMVGTYPEMIKYEEILLKGLNAAWSDEYYNKSNGGGHPGQGRPDMKKKFLGPENPARREDVRKKLSEQKTGSRHHFFGTKRPDHSEKMKEIMSDPERRRRHSSIMRSKRWMTNGYQNMLVNHETPLPVGWRYGKIQRKRS